MRGSYPIAADSLRRYGGNTSCVAVDVGEGPPLLLDLGTGVTSVRHDPGNGQEFRSAALVTHLHFDHVQGLPFFAAVNRPGSRLAVFGPRQPDRSLADAFAALIQPPYFPVHLDALRGDISFHDVGDDSFAIGATKVTSRRVPHVGDTVGYRVEHEGKVLTYISDHQAPLDFQGVDERVMELCDGADLLIHDAQYTRSEFREKSDWGHSTVDYAVLVAREAGARRLCLFHHDPSHSDDDLDRLLDDARREADGGVDVVAASEATSLTL